MPLFKDRSESVVFFGLRITKLQSGPFPDLRHLEWQKMFLGFPFAERTLLLRVGWTRELFLKPELTVTTGLFF